MLLYDVIAAFPVNLQILVIFHFKVKYTWYIVLYKGVSIMADSDKTLITDVNRSSDERKPQSPTSITSASGIIHTDSQVHTLTTSEFVGHKKKPTSFQITSVTVQGSRVSNDGGDDSADDLDESHTEDISSDILDCSRTTDLDNDQLSEDNSNANSNDIAATPCRLIPPKHSESNSPNSLMIDVDIPLSGTVEVSSSTVGDVGSSNNLCSSDSSNSGTVESDEPVVNPLPDQWQHRFKVVKIVSSEPFKRGRWLCMDFMDPPTAQQTELKQESSDLVMGPGTVVTGIDNNVGDSTKDNLPVNRLAHVYEIPPNESYPGSISVSVGPHHVQQPLYGIILPVNNGQTPQIAMVQTAGIQALFAEQIQKSETSTTTQASTQQQAFGGQPSTFNAQQSFPHQSQQNQGLPSTSSQQTSLPVHHTQGISVTTQHHPQAAAGSTAVVDNTTAPSSQHSTVSANIASQPQAVPEPLITSQQVSQGAQQQNQGFQVHQNAMQSVQLPSNTVPPVSAASVVSNASSPQINQLAQIPTSVPVTQAPTGNQSSLSNQTSASTSIPDSTLGTSNQPISNQEVFSVPSQTLAASEIVGLRTPPTINPQALLEVLPETLSKSAVNGEDSESTSGGTSTVAIDNKIEQAMDLVKSHLMFAVREEVDVLKEKITELMDRISQLEYENGFLRANASQETLSQLTQSQQLQQQQQQQQQQHQRVKLTQNIFVQGKRNQAALGKQNNCAFRGKKVNAKVPGAFQQDGNEDDKNEEVEELKNSIIEKVSNLKKNTHSKLREGGKEKKKKNATLETQETPREFFSGTNITVDEDDDDGNSEEDDDMPTFRQKIKLQNNVSKKSALVNKEQQQQMVKPTQDNVVRGKKNQAVLGKQNSVALQGKNINDKGPSAIIIQRAGEEDDKGEDVEALKKVINLKQNIQTKQPEGWTDKKKQKRKKSTSKTQKTHGEHSLVLTGDLLKMQIERKKEIESPFLFMDGFSLNIKVEEIKALSSDILKINLLKRNSEKKCDRWRCHLEFENKQKAIENHKLLQGAKINGGEICVGFLFERSCPWLNSTALEVMKDKLMCEGIPFGADMADIATLFPKSLSLAIRTCPEYRTAFATFHNAEDAKEAFEANENAKIRGKSVAVLYPDYFKNEQIRKHKRKNPFKAFGFGRNNQSNWVSV